MIIKNCQLSNLTLPAPLQGVLAPGASCDIDATVEQVIECFGGDAIAASLAGSVRFIDAPFPDGASTFWTGALSGTPGQFLALGADETLTAVTGAGATGATGATGHTGNTGATGATGG